MLFFIVGVIFVLLFILYVVGFFLPAKVAPCTHHHTIAAPRSVVWEALHDMRATPFNGESKKTVDVKQVEENKQLKSVEWKEDLGMSIWHWVERSIRPEKSCVFVASDSVVPLDVKVTFNLEDGANANETKLIVTEEMKIDIGTWHVPIFRLLMRFNPGYGSKDYVKRLTKTVEKKNN